MTLSIAGLVLVLTLSPADQIASASLCVICGDRGLADALLNIVLFAPFGAAVFVIVRSVSRVGLVAAAFSTGIELTQLVWIAGRDSNPGDVIFNTIGGLLGASLVLTLPYWTSSLVQRRRRLAAGAAVIGLVVLAAAAKLLTAHLPRTTYFGQWTPRLGHMEWYRGELLDARVGGTHIPSWQVDDTDALRSRLRDGAPIELMLVAGPPVSSAAPIFSIADDRPSSITSVGIQGEDAVFRFLTLSSTVRLDQPFLLSPRAFAGVRPGDTIRIAVRARGNSFCIEVASHSRCGLGYRVRDTWRVIYSGGRWSNSVLGAIGFGWLAGLFAPIGFFLVSRSELLRHVAVVLTGLFVIPFATPVLPVAIAELAMAAGGTTLGFYARRILILSRHGPAGLPDAVP